MKAFSKVGLLFAVALLATAAVATSAQAIDINPDNTAVEGVASQPTLTYDQTVVVCDEGTASGTTGSGTDPSIDVELTFGPNPGGCTVNGAGATTACSAMDPSTGNGGAEILAIDAVDDVATANLNEGFSCVVTVPFTCTITVAGPQDPNDIDSVLDVDEAADTIDASVTVNASRSGTGFCGPASGPATFTALYSVTPDNLTIDP
jgi:hypothetical protein